MKFRHVVIAAFACGVILPPALAYAETPAIQDAFSPHQGATALVVHTIDEARETLRVAAYSFTSRAIADALIAARQRGVDVKVVLDKSQDTDRSLEAYLQDGGIDTKINHRYHIMHDKFIVVDGETLETGSFNFTKSAEEHNAENVLVLHDPATAGDYKRQWEKLWQESE
jgi:phosphatidylserine/phosphatidylglycerophosphate/cardiolipin synthase-like enzyme